MEMQRGAITASLFKSDKRDLSVLFLTLKVLKDISSAPVNG